MLPTAKTNAKIAPPLQCEILDFYRATVMRVTDGDTALLSRVSTAVPGHLDAQHTFRTHDGLVMQLYVANNTDGEPIGSALGIPHTWRSPTLELDDYEPRSAQFMGHRMEQCDIKIYFNNTNQEAESLSIEFYPPGFFAAAASPSLPEPHQEGAIAELVATLIASGADRYAQTERVVVNVATPPLANNRATLDFVLPNLPSGAAPDEVAREWDVEILHLDHTHAANGLPSRRQSNHEITNRIFHAIAHRWEAAAIHLVRLLDRCAALAEPLARPIERRVVVPETPPKKRQRSLPSTRKKSSSSKKPVKKRRKAEEEDEEEEMEEEEEEEQEEEPAPPTPRRRLSLRKKSAHN